MDTSPNGLSQSHAVDSKYDVEVWLSAPYFFGENWTKSAEKFVFFTRESS